MKNAYCGQCRWMWVHLSVPLGWDDVDPPSQWRDCGEYVK